MKGLKSQLLESSLRITWRWLLPTAYLHSHRSAQNSLPNRVGCQKPLSVFFFSFWLMAKMSLLAFNQQRSWLLSNPTPPSRSPIETLKPSVCCSAESSSEGERDLLWPWNKHVGDPSSNGTRDELPLGSSQCYSARFAWVTRMQRVEVCSRSGAAVHHQDAHAV